jgi:hypothetical protein
LALLKIWTHQFFEAIEISLTFFSGTQDAIEETAVKSAPMDDWEGAAMVEPQTGSP